MEHPTLGRRRRHKSPSALQSAPLLPVPRLADHLDIDVGPSDEEGGKEAKRQKSEPTTPISTSSRPPNEYDEVMGITQVDSREAERFEEGLEPEFQDAEEGSPTIPSNRPDSGHVSCSSHGGYGSWSLQECLNLLNQARSNSPAPLHSRAEIGKTSNPLQFLVNTKWCFVSFFFWEGGVMLRKMIKQRKCRDVRSGHSKRRTWKKQKRKNQQMMKKQSKNTHTHINKKRKEIKWKHRIIIIIIGRRNNNEKRRKRREKNDEKWRNIN